MIPHEIVQDKPEVWPADSHQPRKGPNSFYKGRSKKTLIKLFMEKGHSKERSRQLAKVWLGLKESERQEIMASQIK